MDLNLAKIDADEEHEQVMCLKEADEFLKNVF
jgi:hypothetical protein